MNRQPLSYLLTILPDETNPDVVCGRIRFIATDDEYFFKDVAELTEFLKQQSTQDVQNSIFTHSLDFSNMEGDRP